MADENTTQAIRDIAAALEQLNGALNGGTQRGDEARQQVLLSQLRQTYESIGINYSGLGQWAAFLTGAWAVTLSVGLTDKFKSGLIIIVSSLCLFVLAFLYYRAGQTMAALCSTALRLERALGLAMPLGITPAFLASFRGRDLVYKLKAISEIDDEAEWFAHLENSRRYSVFNSPLAWFNGQSATRPHVSVSLTIVFVVAFFQSLSVIALVLAGKLELLPL